MSKKLNIQNVNAAHQAAADANTKANEVRNALLVRLNSDVMLARRLATLVEAVEGAVQDNYRAELSGEFRVELEPVANSYGYTLADHPTRRDLVVVQPLEN